MEIKETENAIVGIITKLESAMNNLKNGKQIIANDMLYGVRAKLYNLLGETRKEQSSSNDKE